MLNALHEVLDEIDCVKVSDIGVVKPWLKAIEYCFR